MKVMMEETLLTEEGWWKLQEELRLLRMQRSSRAVEYAETVRAEDPGEWVSGYMQSGFASLDRRIAQLEEVLSRAVPVGRAGVVPGRVGVGSRVLVRWEDGGMDRYTIVGPLELDLHAGRISYESPVGRALMGRGEGESVEVASPGGLCRMQVLNVE